MKKGLVVGIVALLFAVVMISCGGDDSEPTHATSPEGTARILAQAEIPVTLGTASDDGQENVQIASLPNEDTEPVTVTVTGDTNLTVTWTASGNPCSLDSGNTVVGTLSEIAYSTNEYLGCTHISLTYDAPTLAGGTDPSYAQAMTNDGSSPHTTTCAGGGCDTLLSNTTVPDVDYSFDCAGVPAQTYTGTLTVTVTGTGC